MPVLRAAKKRSPKAVVKLPPKRVAKIRAAIKRSPNLRAAVARQEAAVRAPTAPVQVQQAIAEDIEQEYIDEPDYNEEDYPDHEEED